MPPKPHRKTNEDNSDIMVLISKPRVLDPLRMHKSGESVYSQVDVSTDSGKYADERKRNNTSDH